MKLNPDQAMELAIQEAYGGWGRVAPNPLVGCVVLDLEGNLLGAGFHARYGEAHAEVNALSQIPKDRLRGAHVFVTLEPCSHHGKTPPCAEFLAQLPIATVTYGTLDPNPQVSGRGLEVLRKANKYVNHIPHLEGACRELAEVFLHNIAKSAPFVALKVAVTEDGYLNTQESSATFITTELSRQYVHYLRAGYQGILVGRKTIETDDPSLNIRLEGFKDIANKAIILDPGGKTLKTLKEKNVYKLRNPNDVIVVTRPGAGTGSGYTVLEIPESDGQLDLNKMLQDLYEMGVGSVLVEGGAKTAQKFLDQNLVQRAYIFEAPKKLENPSPHLARLDHKAVLQKLKYPKFMEFNGDRFYTGRLDHPN